MTEHENTMENVSDEASAQASEEAVSEASAADAALGAEFRQVGDRLAAAIRAAVGTQEAEALRGEVSEGIRRLRDEFEEALAKAPRPRLRRGGATEDGAEAENAAEATEPAAVSRRVALRADIASALRSWAERAAATIEPKGGADGDAPTSDGDEGGPGETA